MMERGRDIKHLMRKCSDWMFRSLLDIYPNHPKYMVQKKESDEEDEGEREKKRARRKNPRIPGIWGFIDFAIKV